MEVQSSGDGRLATKDFHVSNFDLLRQYAAPNETSECRLGTIAMIWTSEDTGEMTDQRLAPISLRLTVCQS